MKATLLLLLLALCHAGYLEDKAKQRADLLTWYYMRAMDMRNRSIADVREKQRRADEERNRLRGDDEPGGEQDGVK